MFLNNFSSVLIPVLLFEIISTNAQASLKQYLQLAGLSASPDITTIRTLGLPSRQPVNTNPILNAGATLSNIPLSSLQLPSSLIKASSNPSNVQTNAGLDSTVLNNLAIALQLLILSNLMNMPPPDSENVSEFEDDCNCGLLTQPFSAPGNQKVCLSPTQAKKSACTQEPKIVQERVSYYAEPRQRPKSFCSQTQAFESQYGPNTNFVGSSNFVDSSVLNSYMSTSRPNPRSSLTLMSPYEALSPSSPFSDPILSTYGSGFGCRRDFQSPYSSFDGYDSF